jgi:hypothetical protein
MSILKLICSLLLGICPATLAAAQNTKQPLFFIAPIVETVYSRNSPAIGGGIAIAGGDSVTIGARAVYFADREALHSVEIGVFMRFYIFGSNAVYSAGAEYGPFVQLNAGAVVFVRNKALSLPADAGFFSAFLSAGWRFPLGNRFFIEPAIRAGTPYYIGAGVSAGVRF